MAAYDWETFEAMVDSLDRRPVPPEPRHLGPARSGVLAAMMLGLGEAIEPEKARPPIIEQAPSRCTRGLRVDLDPTRGRAIAYVPR
jgi:hypothetical protein